LSLTLLGQAQCPRLLGARNAQTPKARLALFVFVEPNYADTADRPVDHLWSGQLRFNTIPQKKYSPPAAALRNRIPFIGLQGRST
jgi:hypothetical protein